MTTEPRDIRRLVIQTFEELGAAVPSLFGTEETVIVDDGRYVARSYRVDDYMAMWLVEVGIVQFYNAEGDMLATVNLLRELTLARMAA